MSPAPADPIGEFLKLKTVAVVGVSRDPQKWGHVVWRDLQGRGITAHAVNPTVSEIEGETVHPDLASVPGEIEGVVVVTPPKVTPGVLREAAARGVKPVWIQPGAESDEAIALAEELGLQLIHSACVMVEHGRKPH